MIVDQSRSGKCCRGCTGLCGGVKAPAQPQWRLHLSLHLLEESPAPCQGDFRTGLRTQGLAGELAGWGCLYWEIVILVE